MSAFKCEACQVSCNSLLQWNAHIGSSGHLKKSVVAVKVQPSPALSTSLLSQPVISSIRATAPIAVLEKVDINLSSTWTTCPSCPSSRFDSPSAFRRHLQSLEHVRSRKRLFEVPNPTIFELPKLVPVPSVVQAVPAPTTQTHAFRPIPVTFLPTGPVPKVLVSAPVLTATSIEDHNPLCGYEYSDSFPYFDLPVKIKNLQSHFYFVLKDKEIPEIASGDTRDT